MRSRVDPLAWIAALVALATLGGYIGLVSQEGDDVAVWFVAGVALAAVLAMYGAPYSAVWRSPALVVAGLTLRVLGFLGILTVGCPILGAGVLAVIAAARRHRP